MEFDSLARRLIVHIDDDLEKEMRAYPEVDWAAVATKAIRSYINGREICKFHDTVVERAILQDRKHQSKTSSKKSQKSLSNPRRRARRRKG
jgi:hypothetical protein